MKYEDALKKCRAHNHLVGTKLAGRKITNLIIVPTDHSELEEIIERVHLRRRYNDILSRHLRFDIAVLFDMDEYEQGYYLAEDLDIVLEELERRG
jgi:hypothetical protein